MSPVCTPWELDLECCDLPDGDHDALVEAKQAIASEDLWAASGRRWGLCEVTVRPCLRRCGGGSGLPVPYKDGSGAWRNFAACGCKDACSCTELSEIVLDGPVASIVEVVIDGVVLDEGDYRLDRVGTGWRLVRTDGNHWPECSDMTVDCTDVGAFCVTYMQGLPLSALAVAAVSELTCEYVKACIPTCKTCRLPKNVSALVRRGVSVTFDTSTAWIKQLPAVNAFLTASNPDGLTSASSVWSPDIAPARIAGVAEVS